jgi:MoaA/NifB/PqqE/SkfB family radical SAM enzyme
MGKSNLKLVMSRQGLIVYDKDKPMTIRFDREETKAITKQEINFDNFDYFCEVAHLEISNSCNMKCSYCYVGDKTGNELSTDQWKHIIANLANAKVFQVSFGGGEPTLRKDLLELAQYVKDMGMNLGMTTNGTKLLELDPVKLHDLFKQINVSWHQDRVIVELALSFLASHNIPAGINYCYSKSMSTDNEVVKSMAKTWNAELLYLVYKPVIRDVENQIQSEVVYATAKQAANEGLRVAVDGPCVNQCLMKRKFIDVDHLGNVYPCSFIRKPLGNLLNTDFKTIWKHRGEQEECPYVDLRKEKESCN